MLEIIYEDEYVIACKKAVGDDSEISLPEKLKSKYGEVYTLHRLDKPVGGTIMYAKSKAAASEFSKLIAQNAVKKTYLAVTQGIPENKQDELCDLLFKDSKKNKTYVVNRFRKGVKEAKLTYNVIAESSDKALVAVTLITGRSHQIRVQFASRKLPLCGDGKYGSKDNKCNIALWSKTLSFTHPFTKNAVEITSEPNFDIYPWRLFKTE